MRWFLAGLLVVGATWWELAPREGVDVYVPIRDLGAGTRLTPDLFKLSPLSSVSLPAVEPDGIAAIDLGAGEPLTASMVDHSEVPAGWLAIDVALPEHAAGGMEARAAVLAETSDGDTLTFGVVVLAAASTDAFGTATGTIAVPPEWFARAAAAAGAGRLVIGVEVGGG